MSHPEGAEQDESKAVQLVGDQVSGLQPAHNEAWKAGEFPSWPLLMQWFLTLLAGIMSHSLLESWLCHKYHSCHSPCHTSRAGRMLSFHHTLISAHSLWLLTQGTACVFSLTSLHTFSTSAMPPCFIFAFLPIPITLPSSASPTYPTLSASMSQALNVTCTFSPSLLPPPSILSQACKNPCAK